MENSQNVELNKVAETNLLPIANSILVLAWCVNVGLSFISPDFAYPFPIFFLAEIY